MAGVALDDGVPVFVVSSHDAAIGWKLSGHCAMTRGDVSEDFCRWMPSTK